MKKKHIIIIVVLTVVLLIGVVVAGFFLLSGTSRDAMVMIKPPEVVRNGATTSDGGSLVQVSTKLYYSVDDMSNPLKNGVYEISNQGIKRILWEGAKDAEAHNNLAVYDEQLCEVDPVTGQIGIFDFSSQEFVLQEGLYSDYVVARAKLQEKQTENDSPVLFTEVFGITYYLVDKIQQDELKPSLYMIDPKTGEDKLLYFFADEQGAVVTDMYSMGSTIYMDYKTDGKTSCKQYRIESRSTADVNGGEYIGKPVNDDYGAYIINPYPYDEGDEELGIYVVDRDTKENNKVYSGYVKDWYIVDEKYIYFSKEDMSLWRVSLDGETLEQVF